MPEQWYRVELLSDLVVTADAATTSGHQGLDYLPGSLFLGAAVAQATKEGQPFDAEFFLSGQLRFCDGVPAVAAGGALLPALPMPHSFHSIKSEEWKGQPPLNLLTATHADPARQPKQWRGDYLSATGAVVNIARDYHLKSAVDRVSRRSRDGEMFGYQSIAAGVVFLMRVQADDESRLARVRALFAQPNLRLGRSRSAEYGAVHMSPVATPASLGTPTPVSGELAFYLISDLALMRDGMPVLLPASSDFHLPPTAALLTEKTFVRPRRYAPWNAYFNCRMMERQVLCKGGVVTFRIAESEEVNVVDLQQRLARGIGMHREEGLGQVLVEPCWLRAAPALSAASPARISVAAPAPARPNTPLLHYLARKEQERTMAATAFKTGVAWARGWNALTARIDREHGTAPGKTQWANIREIAMRNRAKGQQELREAITEYCTKALRKKLWKEATVREQGKDICLYDAMADKVATQPEIAALTLYYAAVEMGRLLGRRQ